MNLFWLLTLFLAGCKRESPPLAALCPAEQRTLGSPWSEAGLPTHGGTICEGTGSVEHFHRIVIQHRRVWGDDVPILRTQYLAAFRRAGWTAVQVIDDDSFRFSAELQRVDGSQGLALSIERKDDILIVDAHRAGSGWSAQRPDASSWQEVERRRQENAMRNDPGRIVREMNEALAGKP